MLLCRECEEEYLKEEDTKLEDVENGN